MSPLARWLFAASLCAPISACAASGFEGPFGADPAAIAQGAALAGQACGACHGLGQNGVSGWAGAPPFRAMRYDYNAISYRRRMTQMHLGHDTMPPAELSLEEVGDIGAYVRSLKQAGH